MTRFITPLLLATLVGCATPGSAPAPTSTTTPASPATDFVLADLAGTSHDVNKELDAGRNVVLVFWQIW